MDSGRKKIIESQDEWFEYYKELTSLYDTFRYFGPKDDCKQCYLNPYYRPIRYPVIVSGYDDYDIIDGVCFMFTFTYLNDFFKDEEDS